MAADSKTALAVIDTEYLQEVKILIESALERADSGTVVLADKTAERVRFRVEPQNKENADLIARDMRSDGELRKHLTAPDDIELQDDRTISVTVLRPAFGN